MRHILIGALTALAPAQVFAQVTVAGLRVEYLTSPIGIDVAQPRLSWRIESNRRNTVQAAYQLQVATGETSLVRGANLLWDSGKIASDASVFVNYGGPPALSRTRYYWRVRAWDAGSGASPWSAPAFWETGLLQPADWTAQWIGPQQTTTDSLPAPSPLFRRAFPDGHRLADDAGTGARVGHLWRRNLRRAARAWRLGERALRRPRMERGCAARSAGGCARGVPVATSAARARAAPGEHPSRAVG